MRILKGLVLLLLLAVLLLLGLLLSLLVVFGRAFQVKAQSRSMMLGSRAINWVLGLRVDAVSVPVMSKSLFVVSNHCSYLDIYVLGCLFPAVFIAKKEVRRWPVIGWLASFAGTHFIDRDSRMSTAAIMDNLKHVMNSGVLVVVFPEATTTDGSVVKDFKTSLFQLPVDLKVPVLPVSITYSQDMIAWYGEMELLPHLWNILGMGQIGCRVCCGSMIEPVLNNESSRGRKLLAATARNAVLDGLEVMRS